MTKDTGYHYLSTPGAIRFLREAGRSLLYAVAGKGPSYLCEFAIGLDNLLERGGHHVSRYSCGAKYERPANRMRHTSF